MDNEVKEVDKAPRERGPIGSKTQLLPSVVKSRSSVNVARIDALKRDAAIVVKVLNVAASKTTEEHTRRSIDLCIRVLTRGEVDV